MGLFGKKRKYREIKVYSERILLKGKSFQEREKRRISPKIKPASRIKEKKPPQKWLPKALFLILLMGASLYSFFFSDFFKLKKAFVSGNKSLTEKAIYARVPFGKNIFRVNSSFLEEDLKKNFPEIAEVIVYKGLPSTLKIIVAEREPQILWGAGSDFYLVDKSGIAYKKVEAGDIPSLLKVIDEPGLPVSVGERVAPVSFMTFLSKIQELLLKEPEIVLVEAHLKGNTYDLDLILNKGFRILVDTSREPEPQISAFLRIFKEKGDLIHEYVDLRIPGFAYLK